MSANAAAPFGFVSGKQGRVNLRGRWPGNCPAHRTSLVWDRSVSGAG